MRQLSERPIHNIGAALPNRRQYGETDTSNENLASGLSIFPNPANRYVYLRVSINEIESVAIYSFEGKLMYTARPDTGYLKINVEAFSPGLYFVEGHTRRSVPVREKLIVY